MGLLDEVPEEQATGSVARVYRDIRERLGLPFVNLIYRHLATRPERLEAVWDAVAEDLSSGGGSWSVRAYVDTLFAHWLEPLPRPLLLDIGFGEDERQAGLGTVMAYERANAINAVVVARLLATARTGAERSEPPAASSRPQGDGAAQTRILPMQDIARLPPERAALLESLSDLTVGRDRRGAIVPSLFRHFAHSGPLLGLFWVGLSTHESQTTLATWEAAMDERATRDALRIAGGGVALDAQTLAVLAGFRAAIPRMLGAGRILRRLLADC